MADPVSYGSIERVIKQALISLKKGAQVLKYGRKGKPKFCPFRLSNMDTLSLNNDDDYASDNGDSEQEMDENNHVVDESLMSTAEVKDLHKSGTNTLLRHSRTCPKTPNNTCPKIDQLVFREMIVVAIVEHDLPYAFVEYRRVREALHYANPTIEFWCRNTAVSDVFKIFERE
ncbi:unnamed protein product, partial [Brassica oleracea var. botrytis]